MTPEQLKASILQYAIQGKLVEQRPEEGTGEELYQQIQAEKQRLIKEGKIKKDKPLPEIAENEIPFDIPESWKWVRIGTLCNIVNGFTPNRSNPDFWEGGIPWFTIDDVREQGRFISHTKQSITEKALSKNTQRIVPPDTVLLCCTASVGEYAYTKIPLTTNQQFNALVVRDEFQPLLYSLYLYTFVQTLKAKIIAGAGKTTFSFLSVGKLKEFLLPIPPIAEQKRIVAKIEELLPYIDRYAVAYEKLEQFNTKFPEDMKRSILQYAIQGKLVEQRPEEGTGEELYQQIQAKKQRLVKEGKIKKEKPLPEITEDEVPFDIPESWAMVRFGSVVSLLSGTDFKPEDYNNQGEGTVYITGASNLSEEGVIVSRWTETPRNIANRGDVLLVCKGSGYGKTVICDVDEAHIARQIMAVKKTENMSMAYIRYFLQANIQFIKSKGQGVIPGIDRATVLGMAFPIPPLAEQKRIVAKIEELLPLCERLK